MTTIPFQMATDGKSGFKGCKHMNQITTNIELKNVLKVVAVNDNGIVLHVPNETLREKVKSLATGVLLGTEECIRILKKPKKIHEIYPDAQPYIQILYKTQICQVSNDNTLNQKIMDYLKEMSISFVKED